VTATIDWSGHISALEGRGFFVLENFLEDGYCNRLIQDFDRRRELGEFQDAGVGASAEVQKKIRQSELIWLDPEDPPDAFGQLLSFIEELQSRLNQQYYMGLKDWEAFYSVYRPGSYYRRHIDNFRGKNRRIITFILYLNQNWEKQKGGQLRIYWDPGKASPSSNPGASGIPESRKEIIVSSENDVLKWQECYLDIEPVAGRLVVFYAPELEHEVLPCFSDRYCITGWLRR